MPRNVHSPTSSLSLSYIPSDSAMQSQANFPVTRLTNTPAEMSSMKKKPSKSENEPVFKAGNHYSALSDYKQYAQEALKNNFLPGIKMRELDEIHLPDLISSENYRHPNLNLAMCGSIDKLIEKLHDLARSSSMSNPENNPVVARFILNINSAKDGHFVALDARAAQNKLSLIALDCYESPVRDLLYLALSKAGINFELRVHSVKTQKSGVGCAIFSLSFALKLNQHSNHFDDFHVSTIKSLPDDPDDPDISEEANLNFRNMKLNWEKLCNNLPASFYKHVQSETDLDRILAKNPILKNINIRKHAERSSDTLSERFSRFKGTYHPRENSTDSISTTSKTYSESLGYKRIKFIERAMIFHRER